MSGSLAPGVAAERSAAGVTEVTIGAGVHGNALCTADWVALERLMRDLAADTDLRAVLIRGHGATFSAGSNLREWVRAEPDAVDASFQRMSAALAAIEELPVPVVAAVDGAAVGAGCQLALACDLRVLADTARLGMPVVRLGILVSPAFAARLSVLAGPGTARDLLYTGRLIDAAEALRVGLATRCVPAADLTGAAAELVAAIAAQPALALRAAKRAVSAALAPVGTGVDPTVSYDEFRRGVSTFLGSDRTT